MYMCYMQVVSLNKVSYKMKVNGYVFHLGMHDGIETELCGTMLSHSSSVVSRSLRPSSLRRDSIQAMSEATVARARYSALVDERATTFCLWVRQLIRLLPRNIM